MGIETPANKHPHTDDEELAVKFPAPDNPVNEAERKVVVIDKGVVIGTARDEAEAHKIRTEHRENA